MSTAQDIIDRALRLCGVIASGESPTATESADALEALNAMIDSWRNEKLMVYALTDSTLTLVAADSSYTIGSAGDLNTTRPVKVESCFCRVSNIDYPVKVVDKAEWDAIPDKTTTSDVPQKVFYNATMATGTLQVWPVPTAAHVLHLTLWEPIATLAAVGTSISLPPGYERALAYNLAIDIAPEYEREPKASVIHIAKDSKAQIKRINSKQITAYSELIRFGHGRRADIVAG